MARHPGLPRPASLVLSKAALLAGLRDIDGDSEATARVLAMETDFRTRIRQHVARLPIRSASLADFYTSPFVLMMQCLNKGYQHVGEIERDILPAKVFSSMETSAGRMVEQVVLPVYAWRLAASEMQTIYSVIDGRRLAGGEFLLTTLKSGPRCLNDGMGREIADAIVENCQAWAIDARVRTVDFTYGVLYGTQKQSNKKDWHILRNICERPPRGATVTLGPGGRWDCEFRLSDLTVRVAVRIGIDLWAHIAGHRNAFIEICTALIRACISAGDVVGEHRHFTIADLGDVVSLASVPPDFNVSILQRSQYEWLFFLARHFCDDLTE